jgi:hypothetical protein
MRAELDKLRHDMIGLQETGPKAAQEVAQVLQAVTGVARDVAKGVVQSEMVEGLGAVREAVQTAIQEASRASKQDVERLEALLNAQIAALRAEAQAAEEGQQAEVVTIAKQIQSSIAALQSELEQRLAARFENLVTGNESQSGATTEATEALIDDKLQELTAELQVECAERLRLATAIDGERADRLHLAAALEGAKTQLEQLEQMAQESHQVGEVRFQDAQAAIADRFQDAQASIADLEHRLETRITSQFVTLASESDEQIGKLETRIAASATKAAAEHTTEHMNVCLDEIRETVAGLCNTAREGVRLAKSSWARSIDWTANIDTEKLCEQGHLSLLSPSFTAACHSQLRLRLQLKEVERGWALGAFLCAPTGGKMTFRLEVLGKTQLFEAVLFGGEQSTEGAHEWGSPRIAMLGDVPGPQIVVKLELLDMAVPIGPDGDQGLLPDGVSGVARLADEAHVASREAASIRASLVRRVEWRVSAIAERMAAARKAYNGTLGGAPVDDEALEPWMSTPFSAAGVDGLQLHLYPLGYRPKGDEMCGFFLTCPRGVSLRCRVFIGDAFRTFEHTFETKEPYGRGSICRLLEKVGADDSVLCGIEFMEVRQESTGQVRGGPFGHVADQIKVVMSPGGGGMDAVRELSELRPGRTSPRHNGRNQGGATGQNSPSLGARGGGGHGGQQQSGQSRRQFDTPGAPPLPRMAAGPGTKSLPILMSASTATAPVVTANGRNIIDLGSRRRQLDL